MNGGILCYDNIYGERYVKIIEIKMGGSYDKITNIDVEMLCELYKYQ